MHKKGNCIIVVADDRERNSEIIKVLSDVGSQRSACLRGYNGKTRGVKLNV
jgi:hypothetical protein